MRWSQLGGSRPGSSWFRLTSPGQEPGQMQTPTGSWFSWWMWLTRRSPALKYILGWEKGNCWVERACHPGERWRGLWSPSIPLLPRTPLPANSCLGFQSQSVGVGRDRISYVSLVTHCFSLRPQCWKGMQIMLPTYNYVSSLNIKTKYKTRARLVADWKLLFSHAEAM